MYRYKLIILILLFLTTSIQAQFEFKTSELNFENEYVISDGYYKINLMRINDNSSYTSNVKLVTHIQLIMNDVTALIPLDNMELNLYPGHKIPNTNEKYIVLFWANEEERFWIEGTYKNNKLITISQLKLEYPNGDILILR